MGCLTTCIWAALLLPSAIDSSPQVHCNDVSFESSIGCHLQINNLIWSLKCDSENVMTMNGSSLFFILEAHSREIDASLLNLNTSFSTFQHSNFTSNSVLYVCDSMWQSLWQMEPSLVLSHCTIFNNCILQAVSSIKESLVTNIEVLQLNYPVELSTFLSQFSNIIDLKIYGNLLLNLSSTTFQNVSSLSTLSLRNNSISDIPNGTFSFLQNVHSIDLSLNKLRLITKHILWELPRLSKLDLSFNLISKIYSEAFIGIPQLKEIYLFRNRLKTIDERIFSHNQLLSTVDLSLNDLKYLPKLMFKGLSNLKNISCTTCKLKLIDQDLFADSLMVTYANFSNNKLEFLHPGVFRSQNDLKYLDLGSNNLYQFHPNTLKNKSTLYQLNLSQNNLTILDEDCFEEAPNIRFLDISKNKLQNLNDEHVKMFTDLEWFYLRENEITSIQLGKTYDIQIRNLYLSRNLISKFEVNWKRLTFLENLEMDNNLLTSLELPPCIPSVKQTVTFSFKRNHIFRVGMYSLLSDEERAKTDKRMAGCFFNGMAKNFIDLSENPLRCDCELYPFYEYVRNEAPQKFQLDTFMNKDRMTCGSPTSLLNTSISLLPNDTLNCFFQIDCPQPCICGIRGNDNRTFVNCSARKMDNVPQSAPKGTTVLYFDNNRMQSMESLNKNAWRNIVELHLDGNILNSTEGWNISPSLSYLSLRRNHIKTLSRSLMELISNRKNFSLFLGYNDQNCDCQRKELKDFLLNNVARLKDKDDILCKIENNGTLTFLPLLSTPDTVLCITKRLSFDDKVIIVFLCTFFPLLITVVVLYYKKRQLILSFLYSHFGETFRECFEEKDSEDDKPFDAFIAYSSYDRDIVMALLEELEENYPYFNLCIHERNWLPGHFITDNIINSVLHSKRTIIVVSDNFISSPWFALELRSAVFNMSQDKTNKIIVIMADKSISLSKIDPEMRHVISKRTYLVWGEKWFWEKLRYVMPRKSCEYLDGAKEVNDRSSEIALMTEYKCPDTECPATFEI